MGNIIYVTSLEMAAIQYYETIFTDRGISYNTVQQEHEFMKFLLSRVVTGESITDHYLVSALPSRVYRKMDLHAI